MNLPLSMSKDYNDKKQESPAKEITVRDDIKCSEIGTSEFSAVQGGYGEGILRFRNMNFRGVVYMTKPMAAKKGCTH